MESVEKSGFGSVIMKTIKSQESLKMMCSAKNGQMFYVNKNSRPFLTEGMTAAFVDNVDNLVGNQIFPDLIDGSGSHSYQQITRRNCF